MEPKAVEKPKLTSTPVKLTAEEKVIEILGGSWRGSIAARVLVVDELRSCGVISKKKAKKRIGVILAELDAPLSQLDNPENAA